MKSEFRLEGVECVEKELFIDMRCENNMEIQKKEFHVVIPRSSKSRYL